jgi:hypothetical protein
VIAPHVDEQPLCIAGSAEVKNAAGATTAWKMHTNSGEPLAQMTCPHGEGRVCVLLPR